MADNEPQRGQQVGGSVTIPNYYFNGFDIHNSLSDVGVLILLDGQPATRLSMSFTTAKTLARELSSAIASFEKATNHSIMTMDEVDESMSASADHNPMKR